jgi:plasmid maintenance system killer protein
LKKREPKEDDIYYFRINKKFRAIWYIENNNFYILEIDNHQ